jgi:hypothetical protein
MEPAEIYEVERSRIEVYELVGGRYHLMRPNTHGHFLIEPMGVALGIWQGEFLGMTLPWMRWYDNDGILLPISKELAEYERHRADLAEERIEQVEGQVQQERQRAEVAEQRAAALAERLRSLGIDPSTL